MGVYVTNRKSRFYWCDFGVRTRNGRGRSDQVMIIAQLKSISTIYGKPHN